MNTMFKIIGSTSNQCKKKMLVAAILTILAMGGPLQVGAETTVTADNVNAMHITAKTVNVEHRGIVTEIAGDVLNISNGHDLDSWVTQLQPGMLGIRNGDSSFMVAEGGAEISDLEHKNAAGMMPKGFGIFGENNKEMQFTLDKVDVAGNKIENVAEGTADTDAVNVKQLKSYVDSKANRTPVRLPTLSQHGVNTNVLIGANPDGSTNYTVSVNPELVNLTSAEFGLDTDPKRSIVNTEKSQFFDGDVNTAVRANGVKLENTNNLDVAEYTMDGMMADSNGKHVRFGTQGIDAGDQVIAGVKAGVADSDVVTVKQLKDSISNVGGNVKTSTLTIDANGKVAGESGVAKADNVAAVINQVVERNTSDTKELKQAINSVSAETQRVGAHAAAMAALKPIQYDPLEPTQVMAGVGNYRGETAAALGLAHYTNENTMLNVGVSLGSHNMVNAGVTHKFGYSPEKKNIPDRYKGGPISSIYVMQDEMTRMQAKNDAQQVEIEQQRAEIESLKSMVQQLLAKS